LAEHQAKHDAKMTELQVELGKSEERNIIVLARLAIHDQSITNLQEDLTKQKVRILELVNTFFLAALVRGDHQGCPKTIDGPHLTTPHCQEQTSHDHHCDAL
jgi:hypothetical protein